MGYDSLAGNTVHMSSVQNPGWLGYIRDEQLPSYIGIIYDYFISHEIRIPSSTNQDSMECRSRVLLPLLTC